MALLLTRRTFLKKATFVAGVVPLIAAMPPGWFSYLDQTDLFSIASPGFYTSGRDGKLMMMKLMYSEKEVARGVAVLTGENSWTTEFPPGDFIGITNGIEYDLYGHSRFTPFPKGNIHVYQSDALEITLKLDPQLEGAFR